MPAADTALLQGILDELRKLNATLAASTPTPATVTDVDTNRHLRVYHGVPGGRGNNADLDATHLALHNGDYANPAGNVLHVHPDLPTPPPVPEPIIDEPVIVTPTPVDPAADVSFGPETSVTPGTVTQ